MPSKLTPLDIRKQEFPQRFRGYDPDEVDTFLDLIADDAESITLERNQLQERVAVLETQLSEFKEIERSLRDALVMAERMSAEANDNAQRRSETMMREAEVKAIGIIGESEARAREVLVDAENRRRALLLELEALESQRAYAISKFRLLLDDQRAVLESHLMTRGASMVPTAYSHGGQASAPAAPGNGPAAAPPVPLVPPRETTATV